MGIWSSRKLNHSGQFVSLEMAHITKAYQRKTANHDISLSIQKGEIVTLLGENGAGKTTLMKVLTGLTQMDQGEIYYNGTFVQIRNPNDALQLGIGMVHQHFMLIQSHTILENLILAMKNSPFWFPEHWIKNRLSEFNQHYHFGLPSNAYIWQLSAGQQQKVEIMKVLLRGANLLILDEPTSVLTPQESSDLFTILKHLKASGKSVIFISHKLDEIMEISDRVVVLRQGKVEGIKNTKETNPGELASLMMGKEIDIPVFRKTHYQSKSVLEVQDLEVLSDKKVRAVNKISFSISSHQIVGFAGISGNGQKELVEALAGLRPVQSGRILFNNEPIHHLNAREIYKKGISHVPEERLRYGVVADMNVAENALLRRFEDQDYHRLGLLMNKKIKNFAESFISQYQIKVPSVTSPVFTLSGGNIQKLILARELFGNPALLIASHPTYGLDINATYAVWERIFRQKESGSSILLVSEDLNEVLTLSDIVLIICQGKIMSRFVPGEKTLEQIGLEMAGIPSPSSVLYA